MSLLEAHDNLGSPRVVENERQRIRAAAPASTPSLPLIRAARRVLGRKEPGGPRFCLWRPLRPRAVRVDVPGSAAGRAHTGHHNSCNNTNLDERTVALPRIYSSAWPRGLGRARRVYNNTRPDGVYRIVRPRLPGVGPRRRRAGHGVAHNNLTILVRRRPLGPVINQRLAGPRVRLPDGRLRQSDLLGELVHDVGLLSASNRLP